MSSYNFPPGPATLPNWVCWRLEPDKKSGRDAKVPYNPATGYKASASNPATWGTLEQAQLAKEKYTFSGIGFVFTAECGIIGIDIDHCLSNGQPNEVAAAILAKLPPTYIEISPSGKGLHIFLQGEIPKGGNRNSESGVEMYSSRRYFTMTGNRWRDCADEIGQDNGCIKWIFDTYIKPKKPTKSNAYTVNQGISTMTNDALLETIRASKDGAAFDKLWRGDWQDKYKSQSEADFALCCKLAFWLNHDVAQIDRLFRQSGLMREKWNNRHSADGDTYGETTLRNACANTPETYKPKQPAQQSLSVFEQGGAYYRKRGENIERLTNFIVKPIEILLAEDEAQINCELINVEGKTRRQCFLADDFSNVQRFKKVLNKNSISFCFFGSDKGLEDMKEYIDRLDWKEKRGVKALGIYRREGKMVFVTHTKAVTAGDEAVDSIIQLEKYRHLDSKILDFPFITSEQLSLMGELIFAYNEPAKTVSVLAWAAACFIKPFLKRKPIDAKLPHLFLVGEQGSGKSNTLEKVVLPIFARKIKILAASQTTAFGLMKESSSSNVIPQTFNEFKPSTMDRIRLNALCNHLRDAYDGHEGVRGRADQSSVTYELLAPIAVAGEESAQEAAIRERTIELLFAKNDLTNNGYVEAFSRLRQLEHLLSSFGRSLLDTALQLTVDDVWQWYDEGERRYLKDEFPARVTSNLACLYSGLKLVERLCDNLGHSWYHYFTLPLDECAGFLSYAVREFLLDGSNYNKSIIEETFEIMARMNLKVDKDYTFEAAGKHLCLRLEIVYDKYTKHRKDYAITGEVLSLNEFRKQFRKSGYCVKANVSARVKGVSVKVWKADFEALSRICEVSGFMASPAALDDA